MKLKMPQDTEPVTRTVLYKKVLFAGSLAVLLLFIFARRGSALQMPAPVPPASATSATDPLRPALVEVGSSLQQIHIDHWKLSRDWKSRLSSDANSIQQDLATDLPGLLHAAQQSPNALGPQLGVMHNVDALYDVLLRITMAADLSGGKTDAAILDNAVRQLESACKRVSTQLQQTAVLHDQELVQLQAYAAPASGTATSSGQPKTIVVNNRVGSHAKHKTTSHHTKPVPSTEPANSSNGTANPSH